MKLVYALTVALLLTSCVPGKPGPNACFTLKYPAGPTDIICPTPSGYSLRQQDGAGNPYSKLYAAQSLTIVHALRSK